MTRRRWRALAFGAISAATAAVAILAVLANPRIAGIALSIAVSLLALVLYHEIERETDLRARSARTEQELATAATSLQLAELIDPVTKLASRAHLFDRLQQEFRRSLRYHRPLSCLLLDLDRFATINEKYGERFGDAVLAEFASIVARDLRDSDLAARYEGEAFALLLPETAPNQAGVVAERIRGRLKQHVFSNGAAACSLSASFGIAGLPDARISRTDDLVRLAAQALAEAKRRGRDRVVIDVPAEPLPDAVDLSPATPASNGGQKAAAQPPAETA